MLDSYLCEFMWRRSIDPNIDPFEAILTDFVRYNPLQVLFSLQISFVKIKGWGITGKVPFFLIFKCRVWGFIERSVRVL